MRIKRDYPPNEICLYLYENKIMDYPAKEEIYCKFCGSMNNFYRVGINNSIASCNKCGYHTILKYYEHEYAKGVHKRNNNNVM